MDRQNEEKWLRTWVERRVFEANPDPGKEKVFVTVPFPYMNGPLHIGHAFTFCRVDVYARFKRMQGIDTLFPFSWHWTGQPIVAAAERLSNGDPAMLKEFVEIDRIPKVEISRFYDPEYMARYYTEHGKSALMELGLSVDWRREFHTTELEPNFNSFVLWQMNRLRKMGYITKGTHPVVWCPRDQSPTGDHDRLEGEGVTWEEFTLILFSSLSSEKLGKVKLPAATFRPETIFGVTNLWVNPGAKYVVARIEGDEWIVSESAVKKLGDQLKRVEILRSLPGSEMIGERVENPLRKGEALLILPASFVNPENGSGIVYSVPAHAPMDYVALRDLRQDRDSQAAFHLSTTEIAEIKPISLISIPGMGEFPAVEIVESMGIKNQSDNRIEHATSEIYKKEFHQGVLNQNTGEFQSEKVAEAKPLVAAFLKKQGLSEVFYDLPETVVCRCTTECTVKILEDQWFLKYSDPDWKKKAHECILSASIYPESARQWFHDVIDWIKDWPCARKVGLGTPLPWSPGWIVETLSDSTVYMSFYTISALLKKFSIATKSLTEDFFDYVLLGEGELEELTSNLGIPKEEIEEMRKEFLFWYPVNLRNSAKELIPNHLLFFIFQHVAFFPKEQWPTAISANGMMMNEGVKMSKSKGNVITISRALDEFGADTLRGALVGAAEGMDDADWRKKNVEDLQGKIKSLPSFVLSLAKEAAKSKKYEEAEMLLESRIQKHILSVTQNLEVMKTKSAFQEAFYEYWNDLRYYRSRIDVPSAKLVEYAIDTWMRLLSPFIPYVCEEINFQLGGSNLIAISPFPVYDASRTHPSAELSEEMIHRLLADALNIMKLIREKITVIHLYLPPKWTYLLLNNAIASRKRGAKTAETLQRFFDSNPDVPKKDAVNMLPKLIRLMNELGEDVMEKYQGSAERFDEGKIYSDSSAYLKEELGAEIQVHRADEQDRYDPKQKGRFALPMKPALYLE